MEVGTPGSRVFSHGAQGVQNFERIFHRMGEAHVLYWFSMMPIKCLNHGVIKACIKYILTEAEHSRHGRHQFSNENIETFQNIPSGCSSLFKQNSNDCLTLLDHIPMFSLVLLIPGYQKDEMEEACCFSKSRT